jgi:Uma2 family endonuclease
MTEVHTSTGPYTWDDFVALDEDDLRELIDGELVEVEVPRVTHERIVATLIRLLGNWAAEHGGMVLASGYKVRITNRRGVMPDVQFFRRGNEPAADQDLGLTRGRPDLAVEVISPSSRRYDRVLKARWYASVGVPEYWVVDPEARTIEGLVLEEGRWTIATTATGDESFAPPGFDGLRIEPRDLWGEAP